MKKFLLLILLGSALFIFAGCSSETADETAPADESASEITVDEWEEEETTPPVPEVEAKAVVEETAAVEVKAAEAPSKAPVVAEPKPAAPEKNNDDDLIQSIKKAFAADGCSAS